MFGAAQQEQATGGEGKAIEGELRILLSTSANGRGLGDFAPDFEAKHPGISIVETVYSPAKGYDTKAELELAAGGVTYDVVWTTWRAYQRWVANGWITDIRPFIDDPTMTEPEFDFDDYLKGTISALSTREGGLYGLPILNGYGGSWGPIR